MAIVAAVLICAGIIALFYGIMMKLRAGRVADAPLAKTGEIAQKGAAVANPKGAVSAEGNVSCPQPLTSPVSGTMCLYYEVKVTAAWKDGDTHKTKELGKEKRAAQFAIDDGSGPVWVDARDGGDYEPDQVKEETKGTGLVGGITGQDLMFGNYRVSPGILSMGTKYTVRESVLPAVAKLYVCGKLGSNNEITKPSWGRNLLLTSKSRADYLAHAAGTAKYALLGGGGGIVLGIILAVVASLIGGGDSKASTAATATATAAADTGAPAGSGAPSAAGTAGAKAPPPASHPATAAPAATTAAPAGKTPPPAAKGKKK